MNSLTIDLVPKGKFTIRLGETGLELIVVDEKGAEVPLGSVPSSSLFFLNSFLSSCMTIAIEASKPPEPDYQKLMDTALNIIKKTSEGEDDD